MNNQGIIAFVDSSFIVREMLDLVLSIDKNWQTLTDWKNTKLSGSGAYYTQKLFEYMCDTNTGKVVDNVNDPAEGYTVRVNYGYNFEDNFISTGIYGEYGHLKNKSNMKVGNTYNANDKVGLFGNAGDKSTGAHLHYSIYAKNSYYSDSTMRILLGNKYKNGSMYNGSWRTVYNPTRLYEKY